MKLSSLKRTGLCAVCGKPTKLRIHVACGEKKAAEKNQKVAGLGNLTKRHQETARHNRAKKKWADGYLPWWAK